MGQGALGVVEFQFKGQSFLGFRDALASVNRAKCMSYEVIQIGLAYLLQNGLCKSVLWCEYIQVVLDTWEARRCSESWDARLNV